MNDCVGEGESAEPTKGFGTERESKKAQRTEEVWQEGNGCTLYLIQVSYCDNHVLCHSLQPL